MSSISVPAQIPSQVLSAKKRAAKLTLWPLVAATFFMVSGGTYGTEEIIHGAGYGRGILILLFLPVLWCLPTAFMIGELSSALPQEGGYYAWVRRGLGNFWGFQEAWLSLAASIFDMAIYPTLFVIYLKQMAPWFGVDNHGIYAGLFVVATCAALNVAGIRVVGITSLWLFFLLSLPFAIVVVMAPFQAGVLAEPQTASAGAGVGLLGGVLVAMWNYMGWDNASTIAQEVERPQRTYPKAMIAAVILVALTYVVPFLAVYFTGIPACEFHGRLVGGGGRSHRRQNYGVRMAALLYRARRHDERVRYVQRAGDELFAAAAGDGVGRNVAEDFRKDEQENECTMVFDPGVRNLLGALPEAGIQPADHSGHHAVWIELVPGVCDAGGLAHSGAEPETRV